MAGLAERIKIYIDVVSDGANKSLLSFRQSVSDADGITGKFKAGASAAFEKVKANAVAMGLAAGTALVTFGLKAAAAFQDTALSAGKFSDAAGIAVEDASRWMEVAQDLGISTETIQGSFLKMNKAIADGKPALADYGVEIVKTSEGMVDSNATFQNAITTIGAIEDPTKRAKAAQEVFGRSYAEVAELLEMSAGDVQTALKGVSDSKVIDEEELSKARDMRARIDSLKDSFEDIKLGIGEFVVSMGPAIDTVISIANRIIGVTNAVADFVFVARGSSTEADRWWEAIGGGKAMSRGAAFNGFMQAVNDKWNNKSWFGNATTGVEGFFGGLAKGVESSDLAFKDLKAVFEEIGAQSPEMAEQLLTDMGKLRGGTDETSIKFQEWAESVGLTDERILELANSIPATAEATEDLADNADEAAEAMTAAERAAKYLDDAYKRLTGKLGAEESWLTLEENMRTFIWNMNSGKLSADEQALAIVQMKQKLLDHLSVLEDVPASKQTEILSMIESGKLAEAMAELDRLTLPRTVTVNVKVPPGQSVIPRSGAYASGTEDADPGVALVGERGPELVFMRGGEKVVPAGRTRQMLGGGGTTVVNNITQNFPAGSVPRDVTAAQRRYRRTQGPT